MKAIVVTVAVLGLVLGACSKSPAPTATPSPDASATVSASLEPSSSPSPAQETIDVNGRAVPLNTAQLLPPLTAPTNLSLVVTHGCQWCDTPDMAIERVSWDSAGTMRTETLFSAKDRGGGYVTGIGATPDGAVLVAGVCVRSYCGPMGSDFFADAMVTVFRSTDGGVTWSALATVNGYAYPRGVASDGQAIVLRTESPSSSYMAKLPSGDRFVTPAGTEGSDWPQVFGSEPWWHPGGGRTLVSPSRSWDFDIPVGAGAPRVLWWGKGGALYQWSDRTGPEAKLLLGDPFEDGTLRVAWRVTAYDLTLRTWPHQTSLLANASFDGKRELPVLIGQGPDPNQLTLQPIDVPVFPPGDRNKVIAGMLGPVARVTETGDCLRVRSSPSTSTSELGCYADGVLLWDLGETTVAEGRTWVKVLTLTPANDWVGQQGWAAAEFLQR